MSRSKEIALELWGKDEAASMTTADVYQRLAKGIVRAIAKVEVSPYEDVDTISPPEIGIYLMNVIDRVRECAPEAINAAAYSLGCDAQIFDATAQDETDRYRLLDQLTSYYQLLEA